eukprot:Amastigsp_a511425_24.p3 type:complete len:171 gc:universal Amastigsp_a511425_24:1529-2041(+)
MCRHRCAMCLPKTMSPTTSTRNTHMTRKRSMCTSSNASGIVSPSPKTRHERFTSASVFWTMKATSPMKPRTVSSPQTESMMGCIGPSASSSSLSLTSSNTIVATMSTVMMRRTTSRIFDWGSETFSSLCVGEHSPSPNATRPKVKTAKAATSVHRNETPRMPGGVRVESE